MEAIRVFIGAGVAVIVLFAWIVLSARHARTIDVRAGLHRSQHQERTK
jgi:hypothetical protein